MALRTFSLAAVLFFLDDPLNDLLEYLVGLCAYDQVMVGKGEGRLARMRAPSLRRQSPAHRMPRLPGSARNSSY